MIMINGEEHDNLCVGINLGTTNSVLSTILPKVVIHCARTWWQSR